MAVINVGSVVMDARLDTSLFERGLAAMGGLAKTAFAELTGHEPKMEVPAVEMPDLSGLTESFTQAASLTDTLRLATEALGFGMKHTGESAAGMAHSLSAGRESILEMQESVTGSLPVLDSMMQAHRDMGATGSRVTALLGEGWGGFRTGALTAAAEAATAAVTTSSTASTTLAAMLAETGGATMAWQVRMSEELLGANHTLAGNVKSIWLGTMPFWHGFGKSVANAVIGTLNALNAAVVTGVIGLVNMVGGLLSSVGKLFGQSWGWSVTSVPPAIPYLAKGGIVSQPTLAMIGERGREAVLPLENNTGWMTALAGQLAGAMRGNGSTGGTPSSVNLYIDGRKLAEATIADFQSVAARRGIALAPGRA